MQVICRNAGPRYARVSVSAIIDIRNLDYAYRQNLVLKHVTLAVEAGSTVGLIGPNAGGKTTLVKLLTGQLEPTRGTIRIAGLTPRDAIRRGNIVGYVPQRATAPENFPINVRQTVTLGLVGKTGMLRGYAREDLANVETMLDRVGLRDLVKEPIGSLSGGQLQRVYIARALVARPKVLILDEPTTGIDLRGQQAFIEFLSGLQKELELTVMFVSHDLRAVTSISDRIACLNVTLHYHDVPQHLPADLMYSMFACDLEGAGSGFRVPGPVTQLGPFTQFVAIPSSPKPETRDPKPG
jgi:zinc transport system ATP-binding protein